MHLIHRALKLHHYRHTGKLLPHRHTSYRVLFVLLLIPMLLIGLIDKLDAAASNDLVVNATVPAPIPSGAPVITSPANNTTTQTGQIAVSGTCPVITPAIVVAIYDNGTLVGSGSCATDGTFSLPVSLAVGTNTLVATVVTITGGTGASSQPVTITYQPPATSPSPQPGSGSTAGAGQVILPLFGVLSTRPYVSIAADGSAQWQASFIDGTPPYHVTIDWGDGTIDTYTVTDHSLQTFLHKYATAGNYTITVNVTDSIGRSMSVQIAGVAYIQQRSLISRLAADYQEGSSPPIIVFIQRYIWHIYIITLFSVALLWYLEHGRHLMHPNRLRHKR